jgi:SH3-like domain-containing protein
MSDDDFRSLFDDEEPDEKPEDTTPDSLDDETPDWVKNEGDQPPAEGGRSSSLGFTGELEWRQELGDPFADLGADDEDAPDWQRGESASSTDRPAGSGLTGQLDWLNEEEDAVPAPAPGDALQSEHPSWLDEPETTQPEGSAPVDMPAWLLGADNEADQGIFIDDQGELSEDWLASGDALAQTHESEITYDQWRVQQDEASRQLDPEEQVPSDLFAAMDAPAEDAGEPLKKGTDELPDWYLGMEKLDTSEAPDWFSETEAPTPAAPPAQEDLLGDFELEQPIDTSGDAVPDWFSETEAPAQEDLPGEFDLEQALANDISGGDVPDWLSPTSSQADLQDELTLEQSMTGIEDWPSEGDLLGELDLEQSIAEDVPAVGADPDLLDELGLEQSIAASGDVPDWFSAPADEDLLEELDLEQSMAASGDDLLSGLDLEPSQEAPDWFAEEKPPDQPAWLQELGDLSAAETIMQGSKAVPADDDFLNALLDSDVGELPDPAMPAFQDIDSLLASMGETDAKLPDTGNLLLDPNPELDDVLTEDPFGAAEPQARPDSQLSPDAPAWLTELGATVGNVSAAAIVRQRKDRPLDDLSDRLKNLQQRGEELSVPEVDDEEVHDTLAGLLPGVSQVLTPSRVQPGLPGFTGDVALTDEQRDRVKMLKTLVAAEEDVQRPSSAIERTYDSPYMEGVLDDDDDLIEAPVVSEPAPKARKSRQRIKIDRLVISLIVAASIILPFYVGQLRLGNLPPAGFATGSAQQAAYDRVESIQSGDLVLVAVEYGPTAAAELDSLTDVLLRHILTRGAVPVVVSGNPVGLLHADNILETINADASFLSRLNRTTAFQANGDYYVLQYLAGNAVGLRSLSQNPAQYLTNDVRGQATNLTVSALSDFALLVVIAERGEDTRAWAEQIVPMAGAPVVFATGFSAAPLAEPYVQSQTGAGLLVGYRDAYTYQILLDPSLAPPPTPTEAPITPEIVPSETPVPPTSAPTEAPTLEPTSAEVIAPQDASPTVAPTEVAPTVPPTEAVVPSATTQQTIAPSPTRPPSATPAPSATPTELPVLTGIVDADQSINVRGGPGTDNPVVTTLDPGTEVRVLGRNADGSWIQIQLADGTEGWVSAELLEIQEPGASADKPNILARVMAQEATPTPEQVVPEATAEAASSKAVSSIVAGTPYRDERWYSMTFGIIVIVVIIALGSIINVLRSLLGRRDR